MFSFLLELRIPKAWYYKTEFKISGSHSIKSRSLAHLINPSIFQSSLFLTSIIFICNLLLERIYSLVGKPEYLVLCEVGWIINYWIEKKFIIKLLLIRWCCCWSRYHVVRILTATLVLQYVSRYYCFDVNSSGSCEITRFYLVTLLNTQFG
jgi:hypothetical protein